MTCDVYRGSSGTSQTQRHSIRLSDWPGRSDDSMTESTPISLTVLLFLHSRHVLIPLGSCIPDQGTGHTTPGGRWCGSTLLRGVNPKTFHTCSLFPPQSTKDQVLTPTSDIFSVSIKMHGMTMGTFYSCSRSTRDTHPHTHNGSRMCHYVVLGRLGPNSPIDLSLIRFLAHIRRRSSSLRMHLLRKKF